MLEIKGLGMPFPSLCSGLPWAISQPPPPGAENVNCARRAERDSPRGVGLFGMKSFLGWRNELNRLEACGALRSFGVGNLAKSGCERFVVVSGDDFCGLGWVEVDLDGGLLEGGFCGHLGYGGFAADGFDQGQ